MPANSSNLASARSVFEQNIRKNKEAGCEKTIFGQKPSRKVTSRLFAQRRFYGSCNNDSNRSLTSNTTAQAEHVPLRASFKKENSTIKSYDFNTHTKDQNSERQTSSYQQQQQQKEQQHNEEQQPKMRPTSGHTKETSWSRTGSSHHESSGDEPPKIRKEGSISSLADHLGRLNLSISRGKSTRFDDNTSIASTNSQNSTTLQEHRNRVKLPDFRQSSFRSRRPVPLSSNQRNRFEQSNEDTSFSSMDNSNQSNLLDASAQSCQGAVRRSNNLDGSTSSQGNLDTSGQTYQSYQGLKRSTSRRGSHSKSASTETSEYSSPVHEHRIELKRSNPRKSSSTRTIDQNKSMNNDSSSSRDISHNSTRSEIVMTRRTTPTKDWSRRSGHSDSPTEPLTVVPFPTRTVIKRHNSNRMNVKPTPSAMALTRRNAQVVKRLTSKPRQLKQDQQQGENQAEQEATIVDPEELKLLDEIEQLQAQIKASESKIALVEAGENTELKKIEETKERKLRRVDTERQSAAKANSSFDYEEARRVDDEYKRIQQAIKNLKKDNARIHDETRKIKIEILATASNANIKEESTLEMNRYIADIEKTLNCQLREQEQLLEMASYYQDGIKDLQGSLERKDPEISRVKKLRFHYEDKIDEIVEVFKNKCSDADLVEQLTSMAIDEAGWDGDWSEVPNERLRLNVVTKTPYTNAGEETEEDRESPKSVADLVSTSSHSLHIFREEYSY